MRHPKWIYPNIDRWFVENHKAARDFTKELGIDNTTFSRWMHGHHDPPLWGVRAILQATGLTFEEAFEEKKPPRDGNPKSGKEKNP